MKKKFLKNTVLSVLLNFKAIDQNPLIENILKQLSEEFIKNLKDKRVQAQYLKKYDSRGLLELVFRLAKKGIHKKEFGIVSSILRIIEKRYNEYQLISNNHPKKPSPEFMDKILYPSDKITSLEGTNTFTIVDWKQLNIELRDKEPNQIIFKKIINGIPSSHKVFEKNLNEIHLGMTTRNIIKAFGSLDSDQYYNHPLNKKDQVFRLNKALKELFKIPNLINPFFWKRNQLSTEIQVTAFDKHKTPVLPS